METTLVGVEVAKRTLSSVVIPVEDPTGNKVTLGAATIILKTLKGWTSIHNQDRGDPLSKIAIGDCAEIQNQHLTGFGNTVDPEVRVTNTILTANKVTLTVTPAYGWEIGDKINVLNIGAPYNGTDLVITGVSPVNYVDGTGKTIHPSRTSISYTKTNANIASQAAPTAAIARNFSYLDSTFGYPTKTNGYFSNSQYLCLTACGCPAYMRSPKPGATPNPMGTPTGTNLTLPHAYYPPNWSYFPEYGSLLAGCVERYDHLTHMHVWNENKGFYIGTPVAGSVMVPVGSGLVADMTLNRTTQRWWTEGHTAMYNQIFIQSKAVRAGIHITGPYPVLNSFNVTSGTSGDWTDEAFPMNYNGAWGFGDKKVMAHLMYFIRYCTGADSLCVDIRNLQKGASVLERYNPVSIPAAPDPTNSWLSNPEGGIHGRYWSEGYEDGAWLNGQRQIDFMTWLQELGNSSSVYRRPQCNALTIKIWYAEWYAYSNRDQFKMPNPATGNYYPHPPSSHDDETAAFAWQYIYSVLTESECAMAWQPEGVVQGNAVDSGDANPLALYRDNDPSTAGRTKLYTMCKGLKDNFPKGTQLYSFTSNMAKVWGLASYTSIMLVSRDSQPITFSLVNPKNTTPKTVTLAGYEVLFLPR